MVKRLIRENINDLTMGIISVVGLIVGYFVVVEIARLMLLNNIGVWRDEKHWY